MSPDESNDDPYVRLSLELRLSTLDWLDEVSKKWGLNSRGDTVRHLLDELAKPTSNE
jgi:metal-responsive CopG/Arc/MetJ family transcriptional regulator